MPEYLSFGKYRGESVEKVPDSYLKWCIKDPHGFFAGRPHLLPVIQNEIARRNQHGIHIKDSDFRVSKPQIGTPPGAIGDDIDPEADPEVKSLQEKAEHNEVVQKFLFGEHQSNQEIPPISFGNEPGTVSHSHAGDKNFRAIQKGKCLTYSEIKKLARTVLKEMLLATGPELSHTPHLSAGIKGYHDRFMAEVKEKLNPANDILTEDD